jgi:hypothetical protein
MLETNSSIKTRSSGRRKAGSRLVNRLGQRFGSLTVVELHGIVGGRAVWNCICDCGKSVSRPGYKLQGSPNSSCGCKQIFGQVTHGLSKSPEFSIWYGMKERCYNPKAISYPWYGGRGITVCARWLDGEDGKSGVECFVEDMGRRPSTEFSIERVNNDAGYSPENCKWATRLEQAQNRRPQRSNIGPRIAWNGKVQSLVQWCRELNLNYHRVFRRISRGWSIEKALTADKYERKP